MRYKQAGLWHYTGFAVYPDMVPEIIDSPLQFSAAQVVSNSLPIWLSIPSYNPPWAFWTPAPILFPSFLQPLNERPPFGSVHIVPEGTQALASAPSIDRATSTHTQLCTDHVRVTLWGTRNTSALDFIDAVYRFSADTGLIGIMNIPTVRDEKRTQSEAMRERWRKIRAASAELSRAETEVGEPITMGLLKPQAAKMILIRPCVRGFLQLAQQLGQKHAEWRFGKAGRQQVLFPSFAGNFHRYGSD